MRIRFKFFKCQIYLALTTVEFYYWHDTDKNGIFFLLFLIHFLSLLSNVSLFQTFSLSFFHLPFSLSLSLSHLGSYLTLTFRCRRRRRQSFLEAYLAQLWSILSATVNLFQLRTISLATVDLVQLRSISLVAVNLTQPRVHLNLFLFLFWF